MIAVLIGLYALVGFLVTPKLLRNALMRDIPKSVGLIPAIGEIRVNPFLFQLEIRGFSLAEPRGAPLLGFRRFFIDFDLSSIWHLAYSFARIDIEAPYVNAVIAKDGRLNLAQLSPRPDAGSPGHAAKQEPIPAVRIRDFKVSQGLLTFADRAHPSNFATRLEPINFELKDFITGVGGGLFTFTGASKLGERIEWHGHLSVQPIESDGEFRIDGLQVHTLWEYLEDRLAFEVASGKMDLNATYHFSFKDQMKLQADVSKISLTGLVVRPKGSADDWLTVPELLASGTHVDLAKRQAHTGSLVLTGMTLQTWLEPDGSINLSKLTASPSPATSPPASAADAGPGWSFDLHELALRDARISAEDRSTKPAVKVLLAPLSLKVEGASLDMTKPLNLAIETKINDGGSVGMTGQVTPRPMSANVALQLSGIELAMLQPYLAQFTSMTLQGGALSGEGAVRYGASKPALQFTGNLSVAKLHTIDNALHQDFINWDRIDVQGLRYQHDPDRLDIDQVQVLKPYARVIIEPDTSINVKRVLAGPGASVTAPAGPGQTPVTAVAPTAPTATPTRKSRGKPVKAAATPASAPAAVPGMPVSIKTISILDGETDFADLSVKPNFATGIQKLKGSVTGLSSQPKTRAHVDVHGSVDRFAPVSIVGDVNVLGASLFSDLTMSFQNIELSTFNPYSGKFAGYNISKGKLNTDLHYRVDGRKLDAQHHIVIDQLEFGDKTESKDAVSLPIKLAIALMKNRAGVIDLNVPVTGSLDDPKFKLGPIVWKVFVNILEKAVTAPFAWLGSVFGGGPDLQFIDFQPGTADLDPAAIQKAQTLVTALNERPEIKIEVPIAMVKELDAPPLADAQMQSQIEALQAAGAVRKKAAAIPFAQLEPAAQVDLLARLYAKVLGGEPKYPDSIAALKTKPEIAAAKLDFLTHAVRDHITVGEAELTALGQQRAMNVQQVLLTGTHIDAERVFLVGNDKAKNLAGKVRLELSLR
ncbi:MAG: DUF748 domain-containing protein [Pseudomonadota bacterium]|nr:DUF748 domain-containing protein [Pseudomonadota bacterium]